MLNLKIEFLIGNPIWALTINHEKVIKIVKDHWSFIQDELQSSPAKYPIHIDIEPHALNNWQNDQISLAKSYIELLKHLNAESLQYDNAPINIDAGFFYDQVKLDDSNFAFDLMDLVNNYIMMSYRQNVHGPNGILDLVKEEFNHCTDQKIFVAIELSPMEKDLSFISFHGKSISDITDALTEIELTLKNNSCFNGIAIHDYKALKNIL